MFEKEAEKMADKYADNYDIMNKNLSPKSPRHIVKECFLAGFEAFLDIKDASDKRLEPILYKLKDLGIIKSWYYNGTYHAC